MKKSTLHDKIAIIDLESTCDTNNSSFSKNDSEIIEIGAVITNKNGEIFDEFCQFVKPMIHTQLTDFCKELTTITQAQVDNGETLIKAIQNLDIFLEKNQITQWGSWGFYDKNQILKDIARFSFNPEDLYLFSIPHVNVSQLYYTSKGLKRKVGVGKALAQNNMTFIGTHHRGIDDVKNIARLLKFVK